MTTFVTYINVLLSQEIKNKHFSILRRVVLFWDQLKVVTVATINTQNVETLNNVVLTELLVKNIFLKHRWARPHLLEQSLSKSTNLY